MADVKWIKITTEIFDDEKILIIESLPSADSIITIWFKLLILAGKQNNDGVFQMKNQMPYTDEMLATIFRRDLNTVRLALETFKKFGMVEIIDNVITIPNWNKHQSLDSYEKKKERDREYQKKRREQQKLLILGQQGEESTGDMQMSDKESTGDMQMSDKESTGGMQMSDKESSDASADGSSDIAVSEREEEREEEYITVSKDTVRQTEVRRVIEQWNSLSAYGIIQVSRICPSSKRYKNLTARIREYGLEEVLRAVENVKSSRFLQGKVKNSRKWIFDFDWFVRPSNFPKVLEGNYTDREEQTEQPTAYAEPEEHVRGEPDRFSCLEPEIRRRLEEKGIIQGQTLVLGDATEGEIKYLQDCGGL